jgi:hypothetical protein
VLNNLLDRHPVEIHLELQPMRRARHHARARQVNDEIRLGRLQRQQLPPQVRLPQLRQRLIDEHPAVMDDDHAIAHALHVARVVRGEQQSLPFAPRLLAQHVADGRLGGHVQPDRRLVQKHDEGIMQ